MLQELTLKLGTTEKRWYLQIPVPGITVFVGPNDSGKSLILREIEAAIATSGNLDGFHLLASLEVTWPSETEVQQLLSRIVNRHVPPATVPEGHIAVGRMNPHGGYEASNVHIPTLFNRLNARNDWRWIANNLLRFFLLRLDGRTRFDLTNDRPSGDLQAPPNSMLTKLLVDAKARAEVQALVREAFQKHFQIDPTGMTTFRIRLHDKPSDVPDSELALDERALAFHKGGQHIKEASDGVQAFTGIACAVCSGDYRTILIDEPEAFLHPTLARLLGSQLARIAKERQGILFASTHSADFLLGCVQSGNPVQVVRLQYRQKQAAARVVDTSTLLALFRDPLLRSSNVISALFHDGVIVTEADGDRVFYSEIYSRIVDSSKSAPSILVLNAHSKHSIPNVIGSLRRFGVPAAAICDIDVLKEGGKTWKGWMEATGIPEPLHGGYATQRDAIQKQFETNNIEMKRQGGIGNLPLAGRDAGRQLLENLAEFGLFVVEKGELESWLPEFGERGKKNEWVKATLDAIGSDPSDLCYVRPSDNDVWAFMKKIIAWIANPERKGIMPVSEERGFSVALLPPGAPKPL